MNISGQRALGARSEEKNSGLKTIAIMFAGAPLAFMLLSLFLAALAIPAKIFNPKARLLR